MSDIDSWSDSKRCVHRGIVFEELDGFKIIQCELCNFKHAIPLPNNEDLQQIYSEEYYSIEKPLYIQRYIEDKKWWDLTYEQRYSLFESHLAVSYTHLRAHETVLELVCRLLLENKKELF